MGRRGEMEDDLAVYLYNMRVRHDMQLFTSLCSYLPISVLSLQSTKSSDYTHYQDDDTDDDEED